MTIKPGNITLICIMLFSAIGINSRCQTFQWAVGFGNANWEEAADVTTDGSGNVYCTGNFEGTVDFDPGPAVFNLTSGGSQDIFLSKFDASGNFTWAIQLGGPGWEESHDFILDQLGNIYVTGFFFGTSDFDPGPGTFNFSSSQGGDAFICKLNSSGDFTWAKEFRGTYAIEANAIAVDKDGNVYTTGYFDGTADFDPGPSSFFRTVVGTSDMFISKLDSSGNFVWMKQIAGPDGEAGYAMTLDQSGNLYTTGSFVGTVDFDPGSGVFNLSAPVQQQEIFICKLDSSGNFAWAKQMGGEVGFCIATDNTGNIYASGYYAWNDISINKLDPSGNIIWAKQFGAYVGYGIAIDNDCNVYMTGGFFGTRDFDPDTGMYNLTSIGSSDSYVNKLDSAGHLIWVKQFGGTNEVLSRALTLDANDNIYFTGTFNETADFDPGTGTFALTSTGSYDVFLQKMESGATGFGGNPVSDEFVIYPNPTDGNLVIEFEKNQNSVTLVLRNVIGQVVETKFVHNSNRVELQIDGAGGIYLLEIIDAHNQKTVTRIIKK
jgi:hypothetical protein